MGTAATDTRPMSTPVPTGRIGVVMLDCADGERVAAFWSGLLGLDIASRTGQFVFLSRPDGPGVPMGFQQVPEPKVVKNRAHVDLVVEDKETTQRWIEEHGGHKIEQHSIGRLHVVPDGRPRGQRVLHSRVSP